MSIIELAALATFLMASLVLLKSVRNFFIFIWKKTIGKRSEQLNRIEATLIPNKGTSIWDAIHRIEVTQQEHIANEEAFLNAQLNTIPQAIFRANKQGKIYYTNRNLVRLLNITHQEFHGSNWLNLVTSEYSSAVEERWKDAIKDEREFNEVINFKEVGDLQITTFKEITSTGKLIGYLGILK